MTLNFFLPSDWLMKIFFVQKVYNGRKKFKPHHEQSRQSLTLTKTKLQWQRQTWTIPLIQSRILSHPGPSLWRRRHRSLWRSTSDPLKVISWSWSWTGKKMRLTANLRSTSRRCVHHHLAVRTRQSLQRWSYSFDCKTSASSCSPRTRWTRATCELLHDVWYVTSDVWLCAVNFFTSLLLNFLLLLIWCFELYLDFCEFELKDLERFREELVGDGRESGSILVLTCS